MEESDRHNRRVTTVHAVATAAPRMGGAGQLPPPAALVPFPPPQPFPYLSPPAPLAPPAPYSPYSLPSYYHHIHPATYQPYYWPQYTNIPHHHIPYITNQLSPHLITEELPWLQRLNQSDCSVCDDVMNEVCMEVIENIVQREARDIVHCTINDIICSYIGRQWAKTPMKPCPPSQPQPITLPLPMLPWRPRTQPSEVKSSLPILPMSSLVLPSIIQHPVTELTNDDIHNDVILNSKNEREICQRIMNLLYEKILFRQLLTSDLDGGVAIATRTQSTHMLTEMMFNELLIKLLTTDSAN